ncbi:MAG: ATP-binding protein [Cyanobacteria bacterium J06623_5]
MATSHIHRSPWGKPLLRSILCTVPLVVLSWLFDAYTSTAIANEETASSEEKHVLVIHSYNPELSWTQSQKAGIDEGFQALDQDITVYHEFFDAKRYPNLHHQEAFLDYVHNKYEETPLSVMMVGDDPGLDMILANREIYFPTLPIVFMGINNVEEELLNQPFLTGIFENHSTAETVIASAHQTGSDSVLVISDSSSTSQNNIRSVKAGLMEHENAPTIVEVKDVVDSEVEARFRAYSGKLPVFFFGQLRKDDAEGALIPYEQGAEILRSQLPNPLYTTAITELGHGAVGGKIMDGNYHAQQAVELAQAVLEGTPISEVEPITEARNQWIFDAQELDRAGIDVDRLPPESILINVKPSFYSQYRKLVWVTGILFSAGIITITVMTYAIRRQHIAEQTLKEHEKQLEQRVDERTAELSTTLERLQQTQTQLIQTEKMSSLGQLVGGVAHELNNPLTFLSGNVRCMKNYVQDLLSTLDLYQTQLPLAVTPEGQATALASIREHNEDIDLDYIQEDIPKVLKSIFDGAERVRKIVLDLQSFSRSDEQGCKPTDVHQSIESTLNMLSSQLSQGAAQRTSQDIPQDIMVYKDYSVLPSVVYNPGEINQVLLSVLVNAIDVMNQDAIDNESARPKEIFIRTWITAGQHIHIGIKNTGPTIPDDIRSKIFDPFFTTKPVGKGTGLGLAIAYQIMQKHHGNIQLNSEESSNTEFIINLPINQSRPIPSDSRTASSETSYTESSNTESSNTEPFDLAPGDRQEAA